MSETVWLTRYDKRCPNKCSRSLGGGNSIIESRAEGKPLFHCNYCGFKTWNERELLSAPQATGSEGPNEAKGKHDAQSRAALNRERCDFPVAKRWSPFYCSDRYFHVCNRIRRHSSRDFCLQGDRRESTF